MGDETGRLLRYDARRRRVTVLHSGLPYPNGVAVSDDGTHVVVAHTGLCELRRYWLRGPRASKKAAGMAFTCSAAAAAASSLVKLLVLVAAVAATTSAGGGDEPTYETKSIDPSLAVMMLPAPVTGPESLAFDGRGDGPYTGGSDGRILRWRGGRLGWTEFAYNSRHNLHLLVVATGDETGRLLRYDARRRRVTVLHSGLPYPNGLAVSDDGTHVVVAHTGLCELRRYWLRGPRAGKSETFAEVPGYPDNVRRDGAGGKSETKKGGGAAVVEEALAGFSFVTVSEVAERNDTLWIGSVDTPYAGAAVVGRR
uniref:Strictosidine synthase conserved region domain-containing protein n=1 Tax=Oryza barthii TaxID=65489 RepID=A0A0D3H658_9ORYZ